MSIEVNGNTLDTDDRHGWRKCRKRRSSFPAEARWEIVRYVREHFESRGTVPEARVLLKMLNERHGKETATRKVLYSLFPYGYGQQACKIAGMRMPRKLMLDV